MKNFIQLIAATAFLLFFAASGSTQITECKGVMSKGSQSCFSFTKEGMDERTAFGVYRSFVRSEYRSRVRRDRRENEFTASGVNIMAIDATNELNLYAKFNEAGGAVEVRVWFEMGSEFLSSDNYPGKKDAIVAFMEQLKTEMRKERITDILSEKESELNALERQLRRLKRDKDGYEKDIRDAEQKIQEARNNINKNLEEQKEAELTIQRQRDQIEETRRKLNELK